MNANFSKITHWVLSTLSPVFIFIVVLVFAAFQFQTCTVNQDAQKHFLGELQSVEATDIAEIQIYQYCQLRHQNPGDLVRAVTDSGGVTTFANSLADLQVGNLPHRRFQADLDITIILKDGGKRDFCVMTLLGAEGSAYVQFLRKNPSEGVEAVHVMGYSKLLYQWVQQIISEQ